MHKRKTIVSDDDGEAQQSQSASGSEEEQQPLAKRAKPSKYASPKKAKKGEADDDHEGEIQIRMSKDGERYVDLGRKRRATVRSFKNKMYLDIREFYGEGDEKPGKKGISLSSEEWGNLKRSVSIIDRMFNEIPLKDSKRK